jgi:hypothetical protein
MLSTAFVLKNGDIDSLWAGDHSYRSARVHQSEVEELIITWFPEIVCRVKQSSADLRWTDARIRGDHQRGGAGNDCGRCARTLLLCVPRMLTRAGCWR